MFTFVYTYTSSVLRLPTNVAFFFSPNANIFRVNFVETFHVTTLPLCLFKKRKYWTVHAEIRALMTSLFSAFIIWWDSKFFWDDMW